MCSSHSGSYVFFKNAGLYPARRSSGKSAGISHGMTDDSRGIVKCGYRQGYLTCTFIKKELSEIPGVKITGVSGNCHVWNCRNQNSLQSEMFHEGASC